MNSPPRRVAAVAALGIAAVAALGAVIATNRDSDDDSRLGFCDGASEVTAALADVDPTDADSVADLAATIDRTNAPAEIADDWATMTAPYLALAGDGLADTSAIEALAELDIAAGEAADPADYDEFTDEDLTDPSVLEDLAERGVLDAPAGQTTNPFDGATANVTTYLDQECR